MEYVPTIGLEVHVQLNTRTKLFCACSTAYAGAAPNTHVCPVCLGLPGVLPVLNRGVLTKAVQVVKALAGVVQLDNRFDRKNYFYPDLPKAYQITQFYRPIGVAARLEIGAGSDAPRPVPIDRIHMEEDAGKLVHADDGAGSLVDYNRAGVPLLEIVTAPAMHSPAEAREYLEGLKAVLRFVDASDCNMEEGSLRCDANISMAPPGGPLGTRAEIKNLNTFKGVARALGYEIERQRARLSEGQPVVLETRLWDEAAGRTRTMRSKEESEDYRYFPDPDLPAVSLEAGWVEDLAAALPELPAAKRRRLQAEHGLSAYDAEVLTQTPGRAAYFEQALAVVPGEAKAVSNWLTSELLGRLEDTEVEAGPVAATDLGGLVALVTRGELNGKQAKQVFDAMVATSEAPGAIRQRLGLENLTDEGAIRALVVAALEANPDSVESYRAGKTKLFGFFVGAVMKASRGAASPQVVTRLLKKELDG